jgi:hypothetical protein
MYNKSSFFLKFFADIAQPNTAWRFNDNGPREVEPIGENSYAFKNAGASSASWYQLEVPAIPRPKLRF